MKNRTCAGISANKPLHSSLPAAHRAAPPGPSGACTYCNPNRPPRAGTDRLGELCQPARHRKGSVPPRMATRGGTVMSFLARQITSRGVQKRFATHGSAHRALVAVPFSHAFFQDGVHEARHADLSSRGLLTRPASDLLFEGDHDLAGSSRSLHKVRVTRCLRQNRGVARRERGYFFGGYLSKDFLTMESILPCSLLASLLSSAAMARQTSERVVGSRRSITSVPSA
jgi:hypothetical protein